MSILVSQSSAVAHALRNRLHEKSTPVDAHRCRLAVCAADAHDTMLCHHAERQRFCHLATAAVTVNSVTDKSILSQPHDIVHFLTHGKHDAVTPDESILVLTAEPNANMNAQIDVSDILSTTMQSKLVVLAACETGHAEELYRANNAITLTTAFLLAGCDNVIGSLWPVVDWSAAIFMAKFYDILLGQLDAVRREPKAREISVANVLKETQLWMRETAAAVNGDRALAEFSYQTMPEMRKLALSRRDLSLCRIPSIGLPTSWLELVASGRKVELTQTHRDCLLLSSYLCLYAVLLVWVSTTTLREMNNSGKFFCVLSIPCCVTIDICGLVRHIHVVGV